MDLHNFLYLLFILAWVLGLSWACIVAFRANRKGKEG
nr:MAG TPA: cytochrome d ubiquinol oxidase [Caudoviricetes sp.]